MLKRVVTLNVLTTFVFVLIIGGIVIASQSMEQQMVRYSSESRSRVDLEEGDYTITINLINALGLLEQNRTDTTLQTTML